MSLNEAQIFIQTHNFKLQGYVTSLAIYQSSPKIKHVNIQNDITQIYYKYDKQNGNTSPKLMHTVLNTVWKK